MSSSEGSSMIEKMGTAAYFAFEMLGTFEALCPRLM